MGVQERERRVDMEGELMPPLFEPNQEPPERAPRICRWLVEGPVYRWRLGNLRPEIVIPKQSRIAVFWDEELHCFGCQPYDPAIHGPDSDLVRLDRVELVELIRIVEANPEDEPPIRPLLSTARRRRTAKVRLYVQDWADREAGGDPDVRVSQPDESFLLGLAPAKIPRKAEI